jgi:hypothetical protein
VVEQGLEEELGKRAKHRDASVVRFLTPEPRRRSLQFSSSSVYTTPTPRHTTPHPPLPHGRTIWPPARGTGPKNRVKKFCN